MEDPYKKKQVHTQQKKGWQTKNPKSGGPKDPVTEEIQEAMVTQPYGHTVGRLLFRRPATKILSTLKVLAGRATVKGALSKAKGDKIFEGQEVLYGGSISRPPRKKVYRAGAISTGRDKEARYDSSLLTWLQI